MEQVDVIKRLVKAYPNDLQYATSVDGKYQIYITFLKSQNFLFTEILAAMSSGKIASLIGMESGHAIDSKMGALRMFYDLGIRYMTLTHSCNTPWYTIDLHSYNNNLIPDSEVCHTVLPAFSATIKLCTFMQIFSLLRQLTCIGTHQMKQTLILYSRADSSVAEEGKEEVNNGGLTLFGEEMVREMNRLGMLVDLAHVSAQTMRDALRVGGTINDPFSYWLSRMWARYSQYSRD